MSLNENNILAIIQLTFIIYYIKHIFQMRYIIRIDFHYIHNPRVMKSQTI